MILQLVQSGCHGLSQDKSHTAHDLLRILREKGVVFLPLAGSPKTEPHPEKKIGVLGAITELLGVEHPLLGKSFGHSRSRKARKQGSADMTFSGSSGFASYCQATDSRDPSTWDALANSLWEFGCLLYPDVKPDYCTLDQLGDDTWTNVWELELNCLYWRNIFGLRYVQKYGREFFMDAPGWKSEELEDGGIMYLPEESYLRWVCNPPSPVVKDAIKHFQKHFPPIKQHRAEAVDLPSEISRMISTHESGEEEVVYERENSITKDKPIRRATKDKK